MSTHEPVVKNTRDAVQSRADDTDYVALVCVTHRSQALLADFFGSAPQSGDGLPVELHVVDSGSTDTTVEDVSRLAPDTVLHVMDGNRGFAAGINAAVRALRARKRPPSVVMIVNPDVRFATDTADVLVAALRADAGLGVVAPRLLGQDGELQLSLRRPPSVATTWAEAICGGPIAHRLGLPTEVIRDRQTYGQTADVGWVTGGFLAVSWTCLAAVGDWDESYFLYEEEVDFCLRAADLGFTVRYLPDAVGVRLLDDGRTAPWILGLMRTNRVRHVRRRSGPLAAAMVRYGLLVGDVARGLVGRAEARAGVWTLSRSAGVERVLERYRPDARAVLASDVRSLPPRPLDDLLTAVRAFAVGASTDSVMPGPELLQAAHRHQVVGVVCHVVEYGSIGEQVRRANTARVLHQEHAIGEVAQSLERAQIPWMLLKGPILADLVYSTPGVRESADVDVLVDPNDFEKAIVALQSSGARLIDTNWPLVRDGLRGELALTLPNGVLVDLHWHVINDPDARAGTCMDTAELFRRSRAVSVGAHVVRTLDDVDTAVHAAVHAWVSGGGRLRWMLDVHQAVARIADQSQILPRAREFGVGLPMRLILARVERTVGEMRGVTEKATFSMRGWLVVDRIIGGVDRAFGTSGEHGFSGKVVLKSARGGTTDMRAVVAAVRDVVRHRRGVKPQATQDDLRTSVDSEVDRRAYFLMVRDHAEVEAARRGRLPA